MQPIGSGGGGFVMNLSTFVVIAVVVAGLLALGLWVVFSA